MHLQVLKARMTETMIDKAISEPDVALRVSLEEELTKTGVALFPPTDAFDAIRKVRDADIRVTMTMLDPWYNKGVGGVRDDYDEFVTSLLEATGEISDHVFLWGFPEIVAGFLSHLPRGLRLVAWLTWYYKNCPSVIRGWRSSQLACLHLSHPGARLYPEHFLNEDQKALAAKGKLRYIPGPLSVIEVPLLVGFVGRREQTGHPAQKPLKVFEPLVMMTTETGDTVFDPMCGSGTTGESCRILGRRVVLGDQKEEYVSLAEKRLGISRLVL